MSEQTVSQAPAEMIIHSAQVVTTRSVEGSSIAIERCEAFAVRGGKIIASGTNAEILALQGAETELVDAKNRTVLPGFIESHVHLTQFGTNLLEVDCRPSSTPSVPALVKAVTDEAEKTPAGEWVLGWGWDESRMDSGVAPTRWDLDAAAPDQPVFIRRTCAHMAVLNTRALELSGIDSDTVDPSGGRLVRDEDGNLTGLVQESALNLVALPPKTPAQLARGIELAQQQFFARGITTIHDMATQETDLEALTALRKTGSLLIRVRPWLWALDGNGFTGMLDTAVERGYVAGTGDDLVRIQGMKFMLDGSVGGRTAAVEEPYEGSSETGILIRTAEEALPFVASALSHGLRTAIHGIGDRAVATATEVYRQVAAALPEAADMRNRIEHCALPSSEDLATMRSLGIIAASSVGFLRELGDSYLANLGPERMARVYPQRDFADHGITAPPNSDCPVTDADPWPIIDAAVHRRSLSSRTLDTVQNISVEQAIDGYTRQAAMASFEEGTIGSLRPGAMADFIIVDTDPTDADVDLPTIRTDETFVGGVRVHSAEPVT